MHSLSLLDASSSLRDALTNLFNNLFSLPLTIAALVAMLACAVVGWLIAFLFLRPKEVCSMVCSIHFLLVIATLVLGMVGAIGIIDYYDHNQGSLIVGAGVALLALTIPIFILVESFNYIVLSNKHARRHRDLRTAQDKRTRRLVVFFTPLLLGAVLVGVGLIVGATAPGVTVLNEVVILLVVLWVLALGTELVILARARQRRSRLEALGTGPNVDRSSLAALWVSGLSSYRIGRGETDVSFWEVFSERVIITQELLLEEEGELDLVEVEERETYVYAAAAAAGSGAALALHQQHGNSRHKASNRFRRRWGGPVLLILIAVVAVLVTVVVGTVSTAETVGIALAFLAPAVYLIIHRTRRDSELRFATAMTERVNVIQATIATQQAVEVAVVTPPPVAPPVLRPARPTPVVPPATPPEIPPKEPQESPTAPTLEELPEEPTAPTLPPPSAEIAGPAHENPDIAEETLLFASRTDVAPPVGPAHENPDIAEETLLIEPRPVSGSKRKRRERAAPAGRRASRSISPIIFQHYLHGVEYPATRASLLAKARENEAPPNMIVRLEELDENYTFANPREVQVGYAYHRHLRGAPYPVTRDQLLAYAHSTNAPPKLTDWIEGLDEITTFADLKEVMHGYLTHRKEDEEEEEVVDEEEK